MSILMKLPFSDSDEGELDAPPPPKKPRTDSGKSVNTRPEKEAEKPSSKPEATGAAPNALQRLMKGSKASKSSAAATAPSSSAAAAAPASAKEHVRASAFSCFFVNNGPLPK